MNDLELSEEIKPPGRKKWTRRTQRIAIVLWPSFGAAAFGSMICFSLIDPELLGLAMMPTREISALTGHGIVFFFFWCITLLSSSVTIFLRRPRGQAQDGAGGEPGGDTSDEFNKS